MYALVHEDSEHGPIPDPARAVDLLTASHMGRARPDLMQHLRSLPIGRYIAFYVAVGDGIDLVRVLPAARDITDEEFVTEGNT